MSDIFDKREAFRKLKVRFSEEELVQKLALRGWEVDFCADRGKYERVEWEEKPLVKSKT